MNVLIISLICFEITYHALVALLLCKRLKSQEKTLNNLLMFSVIESMRGSDEDMKEMREELEELKEREEYEKAEILSGQLKELGKTMKWRLEMLGEICKKKCE